MGYKIKSIFIFLFAAIALTGYSKDFPKRPVPPRMVNDYAGFLNSSEVSQLEQKLVQFDRETSTQIAIVIVDDLLGYNKADYAVRLGREWGIGQQGKNNGILILIKPKTSSSQGEVFIAPGYGLEGVVPDAIAKRIVENEIIPSFKTGHYYNGIDKAVNTLMALTRGEFTAEEYNKKVNNPGEVIGPLVIFFLIFLFSFIGKIRRARHYSIGHDIPFWAAMTMLGSSRGSGSGSFGSFSSGGGSFGGFGGGSFGGGGAGGSW
ncbi:MAG: TPM domain-containing protein [Bacteroidales bacterium]|nr:TPM domain-containing protein [Bacteroidales bacterium]